MSGALGKLKVSFGAYSCTVEGFQQPFPMMRAIAEHIRSNSEREQALGFVTSPDRLPELRRIAEHISQAAVWAETVGEDIVLRPGVVAAFAAGADLVPAELSGASRSGHDATPQDAHLELPAATAADPDASARAAEVRSDASAGGAEEPDATTWPAGTIAPQRETGVAANTAALPTATPAIPREGPVRDAAQPARTPLAGVGDMLMRIRTALLANQPADAGAQPSADIDQNAAADRLAGDHAAGGSARDGDGARTDSANEIPDEMAGAREAAETADARLGVLLPFARANRDGDNRPNAAGPSHRTSLGDGGSAAANAVATEPLQELAEPDAVAASAAEDLRLKLRQRVRERLQSAEAGGARTRRPRSDPAPPEDPAKAAGASLAADAAETAAAAEPAVVPGAPASPATAAEAGVEARSPSATPRHGQTSAPVAKAGDIDLTDAAIRSFIERAKRQDGRLAAGQIGDTADADATGPGLPGEPEHTRKKRFSQGQPEDDNDLSRLLQETDTIMSGAASRRRLAAISHLKAAVAATVADRQLSADVLRNPTDDSDEIAQYRKALSREVAAHPPLAPEADAPASVPAEPAAAVHRAAVTAGATASGVDTANSFVHFVARSGARSTADVLEAAAAFALLRDGKSGVSRDFLLGCVDALGQSRHKDAGQALRLLLREGTLREVADDQYVLAESSRILARAKAADRA